MKAVIRKELADHFSLTRFPLIFALIFMVALISAFWAGAEIKVWLADGLGPLLAGRAFLLLFSVPGVFLPVFMIIAYLGPLAAVLLGFDAVSRERAQGTLAKILAQPIRRGEVLGGKFSAGLLTLAMMSGALILLVSGLGLTVSGLVPAVGEILRLAVFWLLSVIYLGFWLALALLMSVVCRTVAGAALASGAVWLFLAFFISVLAAGAAGVLAPVGDPLQPDRREVAAKEMFARRLSLVSPVNLYHEASAFLLDPGRRTLHPGRQRLDRAVNDRYAGRFAGPLDFGPALILVTPHLAALTVWTAMTFWLSGLIFLRQEVRP